MSAFADRIRRQPAWLALAIFLLLCLWIASGTLSADDTLTSSAQAEAPLPKVQVTSMAAEQVSREVTLYGRTEPDRSAMLRSEVQGQVKAIYVQEGQPVKAGQKILAIDENDLAQRLQSARTALKQRQIELKGARSLGKKGYQSEVALAEAETNVKVAEADIKRLELALENTVIYAPFDGVLNERMAEVGDLLREGDNIATVVDLDPLIIAADVTEQYVGSLGLGQRATGRLVSGQHVEGSIRYLSSVSNEGTNTFRIEVEVPNPQGIYLAGMSTELAIPLQQTWAVKITPAVMALDEDGNLGVKLVEGQRVKFVPVDIVKSDSEGVWLAGLGERADVISLGHGFVRDGDEVEVVMAGER